MDRSEAEQAVTKILTFADIDDKPPEEKKRPEVMDLDPTLWDGVAPKDREFLIDGWLPSGCVTLLSGDGGIGKSLVAMQAATAVATGTPFLGLKTTKAPVLAIYAEDDPDELHRRQLSICDAFEISMKDLGGMRLAGRVGENNVIARADHNASYVQAEDLWVSIANRAVEMGARLVILDNIAQMFAGNEVNRTEVTQFVALCARLAKQINGAVLLLGHVGKGETAKEYSGSTAWNASVRSRWLLERPEVADDDEANECLRILTKKKANYSSTGDSIALEWQRGAFHLHGYQGDNFVDRMEKRNREKAAEKAFLDGLDELTKAQRATSHARNVVNYAPKLIIKTTSARGFQRREIDRAMERLFAAGAIRAEMRLWRGADRHWKYGIARIQEENDEQRKKTEECAGQCGTVDGNSLKTLGGSVAGSCGTVDDKSLKNMRDSRGRECPSIIDTTAGAPRSSPRHPSSDEAAAEPGSEGDGWDNWDAQAANADTSEAVF